MTNKITSTLAKSEDGNVQITFVIPYTLVAEAKDKALEEIGKETEIPGFRKGMAPKDLVASKTAQSVIIEKTLSKVLPKALGDAINEYKIKPAIYPKFELIKFKDNEPWEIRAITCEIPKIELGDYKKQIAGLSRAKAIWTPGKGVNEKPKEPSKEEKEQEVIKILLDSTKVAIPKLLIDEEVNNRLANLLERIEKLGLSLDGYLSSIGKTPESIRSEYEKQAKDTIAMELILEKIAEQENIKATDSEINEAVKAAASTDSKLIKKLNTPEQRRLIASILRKRSSLDLLTSLI
jgi:FKBP-type peptidyl-prolyl cis-trans isomerase (trigger factor)